MLKHAFTAIALVMGACTGPQDISGRIAGDDTTAVPLPAPESALTRIAFGSCADEELPQPIWKSVAATHPDLFLFMGDNVYVDRRDGEIVEETTPELIAEAYRLLGDHPDFSSFRQSVPMMVTWDDHDFGINDGGREFAFKAESKKLALEFFGIPMQAAVWDREGLYQSRTFGPQGRRVQIILLDTRWFRSPLTPTDEWGTPGKQRYLPSEAAEQIVLGEAQWAWLEEELLKPADLRLVVSSIQLIADIHGWEAWKMLPKERQRFFELLRSTGAENVVVLSGDRHVGGLYRLEGATPYPLYEVTSSSLNKPFAEGLTVPEMGPHQLGHLYAQENFGLIEIDWERQVLTLDLRDLDGEVVRSLTLSLEDLKITN